MYRRVESEQQSFVSKKRRTTRTKTDVLGAHGHVREWEIDYCERIDREEVDRGESRHDRVVLRRECFRKKADQCVMKAKHGLMLGRHVVIDRTNMSAEQRKKFVDAVEYVRVNNNNNNKVMLIFKSFLCIWI